MTSFSIDQCFMCTRQHLIMPIQNKRIKSSFKCFILACLFMQIVPPPPPKESVAYLFDFALRTTRLVSSSSSLRKKRVKGACFCGTRIPSSLDSESLSVDDPPAKNRDAILDAIHFLPASLKIFATDWWSTDLSGKKQKQEENPSIIFH